MTAFEVSTARSGILWPADKTRAIQRQTIEIGLGGRMRKRRGKTKHYFTFQTFTSSTQIVLEAAKLNQRFMG